MKKDFDCPAMDIVIQNHLIREGSIRAEEYLAHVFLPKALASFFAIIFVQHEDGYLFRTIFDERLFLCYDNSRDTDTKEYNQRYEEYLRRIKQLHLFDDDFFTKCFEGSPECTELLLYVILEKPDLRVVEARVQYTIKNLQGRSIRLDVFAVDSAGKRYTIEIQRDDRGAGAKRARYNSRNQPNYHIDRTIRETSNLFGDGSHILYVNGSWRDESPVGRLMHDFSCTNPDDMIYALLADRVRYFKEDKEGVQTMCKIFEDYGKEAANNGSVFSHCCRRKTRGRKDNPEKTTG